MNCNDSTSLFSDYYDGGLLPAERDALEAHLKGCSSCTVEFKHFSEGLKALHDTKQVQTTEIFLANVRAAAEAHTTRKENFLKPASAQVPAAKPAPINSEFATTEALTVRTPTMAPPPERAAIPTWVPWSIAAAMLLSFGLGRLVFNQSREVEDLRRNTESLERELHAARVRAATPRRVEAPPPDVDKIMAENGLEKDEAGRWLPKFIVQAFKQDKVVIGGEVLSREDAATKLAKAAPPPPVKTPEIVTPPPPDPEKAVADAMAAAGYRKYNNVWLPEAWAARFDAEEVLVGVDQWKKKSDFKDELIKEHGLVEHPRTKKLMTREQLEAQMAQQLVRKPAAAPAENELTRLLDGLQIGPPRNFKGLTVYPILPAEGAVPVPVTYMTLHTAEGPGTVDLLDASMFSAQVKNPLDAEILLLAGEVLTGGRCSRIVAEDTLIPRKDAGKVPVFCVEPGAWRTADKFAKESGHFLAPPSLRRALVWEQGQGAVWSLLSRRLDKTHGSLAELYRKRQDEIAERREYFTVLADREPDAIGVAVAAGDALDFVEIFQDHTVFAGFLDRVITAAALDLLEHGSDAVARGPAIYPNSVKGVKQFLESAFFWSYEPRDEGYGVRKDDAWIGRARVTGGTVSHALLFTPGVPEWDHRAPAAVPRTKMSKAIEESEARLKGLGPAKKAAAIRDVASISSPEVTALLARHLGETDPEVRRVVVQELGASGDPHAAEALLPVFSKSRNDGRLFADLARALARLGDERAVEPFLRQLDQGDADLARVLVAAMPELLLQVRTRDLLERATARLVTLYEASDGAMKGDVALDPVVKGMKAGEAQALLDLVRASLRQLTGREFASGPACRAWWNDRETREKFLRERTGK